MLQTRILIVAATVCWVFTAASQAEAQGSNRSVSRPTVRSFTNYLQAGLGWEYYDPFVGPMLRKERAPIQRRPYGGISTSTLGGSTTSLSSLEVERAKARNLGQAVGFGGMPAAVAPTGQGAAFMNYSHYYGAGRVRRR